MKISKEVQDLLSKTYHSPDTPYGYSTPVKLWKHVRKTVPTLTLSQVKYWFTTQDVPSRFQQAHKTFPRASFITRDVHVQWLADLADLGNLKRYNNNFRYLFVVQDLFSRQLLGLVALKRKLSKNVADALNAMIHNIGKSPKVFYTDSGTEFAGHCNVVYEKYNIEHATTNDFVQKAAPTERAILVIKQRLYKMMAAEKSFKWTDKLESVLKAYNTSYNRNLGMTPTEASLRENKHKVFYNTAIKPQIEKMSFSAKPYKYKLGQVVRVQIQQPFGKSYVGNYSQVLYTITNRELKGGVPVYHLAELLTKESLRGSFYSEELQPVSVLDTQRSGKKVQKIHSFRMVDNTEQVLVNYEGEKTKVWVNYTDLIPSVLHNTI